MVKRTNPTTARIKAIARQLDHLPGDVERCYTLQALNARLDEITRTLGGGLARKLSDDVLDDLHSLDPQAATLYLASVRSFLVDQISDVTLHLLAD